jgi:hypothetical protein
VVNIGASSSQLKPCGQPDPVPALSFSGMTSLYQALLLALATAVLLAEPEAGEMGEGAPLCRGAPPD